MTLITSVPLTRAQAIPASSSTFSPADLGVPQIIYGPHRGFSAVPLGGKALVIPVPAAEADDAPQPPAEWLAGGRLDLSLDAVRALVELVESPPEPTDALRHAVELHRR